jgi:8-oxo-dGTP diphosphatase
MDRPKIIRPAAYALITQDRSLLLCRLCPPEKDTGKWTLPGGGLDFGESPEDGARREVQEETGLAVELGDLCCVQSELFDSPDRQLHALRFIYRVKTWSGAIRGEKNGSTDTCAFIPFEALEAAYRHPEFGEIVMVPLAEEGLRLATQTCE